MRLSAGWLLLVLLLPLSAAAQRATERYAPDQLAVARDLLESARASASLAEYAAAKRFAREAQLDARLAWQMTDAGELRAQAAAVGGEALALERSVAMLGLERSLRTNSPGRGAAWYRSAYDRVQAAAPSPR